MGGERMTGILARRRGMMMQAQPTPSNKIVPDYWESGGINSSGSNTSTTTSQRTALIPVPSGATAIKRLGEASYNSNAIYFYVHGYTSNATWKSPRGGPVSAGGTMSIADTWTTRPAYIKITFAFSTSSGVTMSDAIRAACYNAEWVF